MRLKVSVSTFCYTIAHNHLPFAKPPYRRPPPTDKAALCTTTALLLLALHRVLRLTTLRPQSLYTPGRSALVSHWPQFVRWQDDFFFLSLSHGLSSIVQI